jgi:hypothetical protein
MKRLIRNERIQTGGSCGGRAWDPLALMKFAAQCDSPAEGWAFAVKG